MGVEIQINKIDGLGQNTELAQGFIFFKKYPWLKSSGVE